MGTYDNSKTMPKNDEIVDRLQLASLNSPQTMKDFRVIFKFNQMRGRYEHEDYNINQTKNIILKSEIRDIFDYLEEIEDCSYKHMKCWTQKRLLIFVGCILTLLLCVNLYLLVFWQSAKDKKQIKRMKKIQKYLDNLNKTKYKKVGWTWKVGKWGGWIELNRDVAEFMFEEQKRLSLINGSKLYNRSGLSLVPAPIDGIDAKIDNDELDQQMILKSEYVNTQEFNSPIKLGQNIRNDQQFDSNKSIQFALDNHSGRSIEIAYFAI